MPPSPGLRQAPHIPPDLPGEEQARARPRLHALSALPERREGRLSSPTLTPSPRLGARVPPRCSPLPPPPPPPDPSPPGAPAPPLPPTHPPIPRPGLSRTSLRSWRPHVFTGLPAPVDVVSRSDFQARPQLRRQHQPGTSRAPRRCAPRRRRARPPQLSHPPHPGPAQPPPRPRRAQPCHPPTLTSGGCSNLEFCGYWGPAGELSASLALLAAAAAAAGTLAAASCAPSLPRAAPGLRTLAPDLSGGTPRSYPWPRWVSWLGLGSPGVNVQLGVCGDRIRGTWGSGLGRGAPALPAAAAGWGARETEGARLDPRVSGEVAKRKH